MNSHKKRSINIDVIKGLGILSVILLHTFNTEYLLKIGAPFYIWQAVPVFIILQGFNLTNSYKRRDFKILNDFNDKQYHLRRIQRLIFPYLIFFAVQTLFLWLDTPDYFMEQNHLQRFITGGRGPGSYFVPLTIQTQILLPFFYLVGRKSVKGLLIGSFLLGTGLEVLSASFHIPEELYRILILRFVFAIALGVALSLWEKTRFRNRFFYGLLGLSILYITGVMYFDWHFLMEHYWHSQHLLGFFYPLALILFLRQVPMSDQNWVFQVLRKMGVASYHIFFVQILYFWEPIKALRPDLPFVLGTVMNLLICSILGIWFHHFEQKLWKKLKELKNGSN